ncbi:MAG: hypothetical protein KBC96_14435 [Armatimonadetes bacterium]|nr:hypothetical protein [Armatimonadota bacterium]
MVRGFKLVFALALVLSSAAWSLPLNGYNEIVNPGFGTGNLQGWQAGADIIVAMDGPEHGYAATCKRPGGDLWLRQIVDDSLSPGWLPNGTAKYLDLTADVTWSGWLAQNASVSFRLDWWDERYNAESNPTLLPYYLGGPRDADPQLGYFVSDWVTISLANYAALDWQTVNPFDRILLPIQPRWVSVEAVYVQPDGVGVWLDNVNLTGQCVPEPSGIALLLGGIAPIALGGRLIRRK